MHAKHMIKVLGLVMLAAVGVMAVSASGAQAKWLLLENGVSVASLEASAMSTQSAGHLLVPALGEELDIKCTEAKATATATLEESGAKLHGSGKATFTGCSATKAGTCMVNSPEQPAGTIVAKGEGTGDMREEGGEEVVFATLESPEFTEIDFSGAKCGLNEAEEPVSGSVLLVIHKPLADEKLHLVLIVDHGKLELGTHEAKIEGENEGEPVPLSATLLSGNTWAIHLVP